MLISVKLLFSVMKNQWVFCWTCNSYEFVSGIKNIYKIPGRALCCFYFLIKANFKEKLLEICLLKIKNSQRTRQVSGPSWHNY